MIFNNFSYSKERSHENKTYWKCTQYCKRHCLARCHTINDAVVFESQNHNHEPEANSIATREILLNMKRAATTTMDSTSQIIASSVRTNSSILSASLPSLQCIKRTIQRKRQNHNQSPYNPSNLNELVIPEQYTRTLNNEIFLQFDNRETNRIIIFATERNLNLLRTHRNWYCDGTFKVCPGLFHQLYTINIIINNSMIPVVYALMSTRNSHTYDTLYEFILSKTNNTPPVSITMDFEKAAITSIQRKFTPCNIYGCFFHFNQSIWKKIQSLPVIFENYNSNDTYKLNLRMIVALAFVPIDDVAWAYYQLITNHFFQENGEDLAELLNYFSNTWIGTFQTIYEISPPMFSRAIWNCYSRIISNVPLTNNQLEGWHHGFNKLVNSSHPSIWTFIDKMREQQSLSDFELTQVLSGIQVRTQKRYYRQKYERLTRICLTYNRESINSYLTQIAYNISF